jgi:hypothetical protein
VQRMIASCPATEQFRSQLHRPDGRRLVLVRTMRPLIDGIKLQGLTDAGTPMASRVEANRGLPTRSLDGDLSRARVWSQTVAACNDSLRRHFI